MLRSKAQCIFIYQLNISDIITYEYVQYELSRLDYK